MPSKGLISIIMNCHNGETYLKEAIQSVLNQSYKNWELIFWDNNSTDKSAQIFQSFQDKRLKYFFTKKKLVCMFLEMQLLKKQKVIMLLF